MAIGWNDVTANITSVNDSRGNIYHQAVATSRGNGMSQAIYYASSIAAAPAGATQVTVTFNQTAVYVDLRATEYSGVRAASPFVVGTSATGTGSSATTNSIATSAPSTLLFAAGMTGAVFNAAGAGYTSRVITSPDGDIVEDRIAASAGSYSASATLSGGTWLLQLAAFAPE